MNDPDPSSRRAPGLWRGLAGLFTFFRRTAEQAADEAPQQLTETGGELVAQAQAFQALRVEDVMKPRADIVGVERGCSFAELVARFAEAEHSRMPVFKETLDEPVGVAHMKDVFKLLARKSRPPKPDDRILMGRHNLVREVLYVPPSMSATQLLTTMRAKRIHMALVIDEFGGVDGLVTLEDLLETLVGEIEDEHDDEPEAMLVPLEGGMWQADARAELDDVGAAIDSRLGAVEEDVDTLGGLAFVLAGHVPGVGAMLAHDSGWMLEVVAGDEKRVTRLRLHPPAPLQVREE